MMPSFRHWATWTNSTPAWGWPEKKWASWTQRLLSRWVMLHAHLMFTEWESKGHTLAAIALNDF